MYTVVRVNGEARTIKNTMQHAMQPIQFGLIACVESCNRSGIPHLNKFGLQGQFCLPDKIMSSTTDIIDTRGGSLDRLATWKLYVSRETNISVTAVNGLSLIDNICRVNAPLKQKCTQYPAIHTNYSLSNCIISNKKDFNRSSDFLVIN